MIRFEIKSEQMRHYVALAFQANASRGKIEDASGTVIQRESASALILLRAQETENAAFDDLDRAFVECGLDIENNEDRLIFWGFRNALQRVARGESWVPSAMRVVVRSDYKVAARFRELPDSFIHIEIGPHVLRLVENDSAEGQIYVTTSAAELSEFLAGNPERAEWGKWIRDGKLEFSKKPLWLKLVLKLL